MNDDLPRGKGDPDACEFYPGQEPDNSDPADEHHDKEQSQ